MPVQAVDYPKFPIADLSDLKKWGTLLVIVFLALLGELVYMYWDKRTGGLGFKWSIKPSFEL